MFALIMGMGHSWYPIDCCGDYDCDIVISARVLGDGSLEVTTKHGAAQVPADLKRHESPDGQMHACIRFGKVICVFYPPAI